MICTTLVATCILLQSVTAAPQALLPEKKAELSLAEAKLEAVRSIVNGDGKEGPVSKMTELLAAANVRAPAAPRERPLPHVPSVEPGCVCRS